MSYTKEDLPRNWDTLTHARCDECEGLFLRYSVEFSAVVDKYLCEMCYWFLLQDRSQGIPEGFR